jgi:MFS-type transporter involved in bile tolerance (Atg22 family)
MSTSPSSDLRPSFISPRQAYLAGVACWFMGMGLQFVMIPTLAAVYLRVSAQELALAQMSISIPQLLILPFSGRIADRTNGRKLLMVIHLLAVIPPVMIFWLVWSNNLSYWNLIVYGMSMGAIFAFSAPTRDALLTRVSPVNIQKGVMAAMITQFIAQLTGFTLAGIAAPLADPWALPAMNAIVLFIGFFAAFLLPSYPALSDDHGPDPGSKLTAGLKAIYHSRLLFPVLLMNLAVGIIFVGCFMVSFPLIIRDIFHGGQLEISIISFCFWGGTIATTVLLIAQNFYAMCLASLTWGAFAGFNMTMSRTIVQVSAPPRMRAQILAFYNLGFIGAAPIGAFAMGMLSPIIGPQLAPALASILMLFLTISLCLFTDVLKITRLESESL